MIFHGKYKSIVFYLLTFVALAIGLFSLTSVKVSSETLSFDQKNLTTLGFQNLSSSQWALISSESDKKNARIANYVFTLSSGKQIKFETNKATNLSLVEGNKNNGVYVKGEGVVIRNQDETQGRGQEKVEPAIFEKVKSKDQTVAVIIQLNLPFKNFFEKGQNADKVNGKNANFEKTKNKVASKFNAKSRVKKDLKIINSLSADIDQDTLEKLLISDEVKKIELDKTVKITLDTSLDQIHVKDVWPSIDGGGNTLTGIGKTVAILDTGVDYTHSDLGGCLGAECKVMGGYDFINNDANPMDDHGHGTHVAATAAGRGLLNGVAPEAKILAVKVLSAGGSGLASQIIAGIQYATDPNGDGDTSDRVDVGSMSLGGSGDPDDAMSLAVDNSSVVGVIWTIAAGNSGPGTSTINSPGTARSAITVAASCKTGDIGINGYCSSPIASFSSRGPLVWNGQDIQKPDIAAPGVSICAARWGTSFSSYPTCFDSQHVRINGTSMATPHMAGAAILVKQAHPDFTPNQVKQLLKSTTNNLGMSYNDQGAGEVDVKKAIPISSQIVVAPSGWNIDSDPTNKISSHSKTFSVTNHEATASSLLVDFDINVPGATASATPSTISMESGESASFDVNFTIDNDVALAGNYLVKINLSQEGVRKASVPVFLNIKPTVTAVPSDLIDYGIDIPSSSSWTSDTKTITLNNLRLDKEQALNVAPSSYQAGISFQIPDSVTVPASGSATINSNYVVDNTQVPNTIYSGDITFSNTANLIKVKTQFIKFYILNVSVNDAQSGSTGCAQQVILYDQNSTKIIDCTNDQVRKFFINTPGTYDVIIRYFAEPTANGLRDFMVFKEGVNVSGVTDITVSKNEAKNLVKMMAVDSSGAQEQDFIAGNKKITYTPNNFVIFAESLLGGSFGHQTELYVSNISPNYKFEEVFSQNQPVTKVHIYYGEFTGIQDNLTLTNTPSDFHTIELPWDLDVSSGNALPVVYLSGGWVGYYNNNFLTIPLGQTIYSLVPDDTFVKASASFIGGSGLYNNSENTPLFSLSTTPKRWMGMDTRWPLPDAKENVVYAGLGPSFWIGKFSNSSTTVSLWSYYGGSLLAIWPGLVRQDYTTKAYPQTAFSLYKSGALYYSGHFDSYPGNTYQPTGITVDRGSYEFRSDFTYKSKGMDMNSQVRATFDTNLTDSNPPALKRLYFLSDGKRSEEYNPSVINSVEFELDPVGGNLSNVQVSYSSDGSNFSPVQVSNNAGVYTASIASFGGVSKASIKISATDNSNNTYSYSFEVPVSDGTPLPTPTPTPTPTPDTTPPSVNITSPVDNSTVKKNTTITITASASDNIGISKVEFYVNDSLKCTDNSSLYTCNWKVPQKSKITYTILAKAYDNANNTSSSTVSVTSK